ncbi:hypothetical protein HOG98_06980 [bacterium]|jgi:hypothetical protein|nr:hypothetical protein [bacterium]
MSKTNISNLETSDIYEGLSETMLSLPQTETGTLSIFGMSIYGMILGFIFSIVGLIYFRKGRKDGDILKLFTGIALLSFPMFVRSSLFVLLIGIGLTILPWIAKRISR